MPATQTLHDQVAVIPPMVTPVTVIEDPRSRMDRLERRIGQMRDPDEMIPWDDLDDVPVATLPVGFRMPDIERLRELDVLRRDTEMVRFIRVISSENLGGLSTGVFEQYSFSGDTSVTRRELEFLRQGSDESVSSFISRWREKVAEMIERPTERDQMSISLVQALFDVDDDISRGLWSDITHSPDTGGKESLQTPRSDLPPLQHRHPHPVQQYPSVHPHTVTVRPSFQFQRPQTSIPRHEQSRPHRRRQRTYSDLGMPLDRVFERLRSTGVLVHWLLGHPEHLTSTFSCSRFCAFHQMAGHRTDYCASLRHTIQDLLTVVQLAFHIDHRY
ncbi:hypothetical protein CK203_106565 [Vitis vinifera]|uniref:Retrotransposon gag domain-containing protein n=1 Tax=Vitis vinifera TaxID=29760 RepID=A0A438DVX3_VITVI|nr:hypothetical protein CK203_106565 [Vitis vinifera]